MLDILKCRDKDNLVKYLREKKDGGLLAGVEEVTFRARLLLHPLTSCAAPSPPASSSARMAENQNLQEQLTKARREIQRGLSKEEAKELKGTRWLWVKN